MATPACLDGRTSDDRRKVKERSLKMKTSDRLIFSTPPDRFFQAIIRSSSSPKCLPNVRVWYRSPAIQRTFRTTQMQCCGVSGRRFSIILVDLAGKTGGGGSRSIVAWISGGVFYSVYPRGIPIECAWSDYIVGADSIGNDQALGFRSNCAQHGVVLIRCRARKMAGVLARDCIFHFPNKTDLL